MDVDGKIELTSLEMISSFFSPSTSTTENSRYRKTPLRSSTYIIPSPPTERFEILTFSASLRSRPTQLRAQPFPFPPASFDLPSFLPCLQNTPRTTLLPLSDSKKRARQAGGGEEEHAVVELRGELPSSGKGVRGGRGNDGLWESESRTSSVALDTPRSSLNSPRLLSFSVKVFDTAPSVRLPPSSAIPSASLLKADPLS